MSKRSRAEQLSPTMVRMTMLCKQHGEHVLFLASGDDTARLVGQWIVRRHDEEPFECRSACAEEEEEVLPF